MARFKLILAFTLPLLLTSCFKEDERVIPYTPGDVSTTVIGMMEDYRYMAFFSLSEGRVIDSSIKYEWDLALTSKENDYTLHPNTSLFLKIAHTESFNFDSTYTVNDGLSWQFDSSDGDPAGNAIGDWWLDEDSTIVTTGEVLLVDRGIDAEGLPRGYLKIQPSLNIETKTVTIRIASLNGSDERSFELVKDTERPFTVLSFETGVLSDQPFPPTNEWDLWFTQYTTLLYTDEGEAYPYLVTGTLINRETCSVTLDTIHPFNNLSRELAESFEYSSRLDTIGYNWKKINGDVTSGNVTYTPRPNYSYIIKTVEGYYYKLRFIDFYNQEGKKGYPKIEYQRL